MYIDDPDTERHTDLGWSGNDPGVVAEYPKGGDTAQPGQGREIV